MFYGIDATIRIRQESWCRWKGENNHIEMYTCEMRYRCKAIIPPAAYWGCMITKAELNMIERCLKTGLHVIFQ